MTDEEKITMLKALCEDDEELTDSMASVYLAQAEAAIFRRLYPFSIPDEATVPKQYEMLQCELASRYFFRRGGQGESHHHENGVIRVYGSVNDEDLLMEVMQIATI